jgi:hypothetical protein
MVWLDLMSILSFDEIDKLRAELQRCIENDAQAWVEHWPEEDQSKAEIELKYAKEKWAEVMHENWPIIRLFLK